MKKINKLIELLNEKDFKNNDSIFCYANEVEDFLNDHIDQMHEENAKIAYYLEDSLLDIFEPLEPGMKSYRSFLEGKEKIRIASLKMVEEL